MTFTWIEIVGFLAFLTNVVGNFMLARKIIWAWPVRLVSITLWGFYAVDLDSPSLLANALTFFAINCYGWHHWRKTREDPNTRVLTTRFRDVDRDGPEPAR